MCESNVYLLKSGIEELLMEKVDRLIPGEEDTIFLENVFGERRLVKARIKEMELVHHRIVLTEIGTGNQPQQGEWWLEPLTNHGHFHAGEEVVMKLCWGYNMQPAAMVPEAKPQVYLYKLGQRQEVNAQVIDNNYLLNLGENADGVISMYAHASEANHQYYAKLVLEIGHHNHHTLEPTGIPLEIMPLGYQHAHVGEHYEIKVLYNGQPLAGAEVLATYQGNTKSAYPVRVYTNEEGQARIFLAARGNYLLSCQYEMITSTFTLIKNY